MKKQKQLKLQTLSDTQDKESSTLSNNVEAWQRVEDTPFTVVEIGSGWIIVLGRNMVSEKQFETKEDAINYINSKPWNLIIIAAAAYIEQVKQIEKNN